jgi:hypothetical protein
VAVLSPLQRGGGVQSRRTRGGAGALPSREAGSEAIGSMAVPEPSLAGR